MFTKKRFKRGGTAIIVALILGGLIVPQSNAFAQVQSFQSVDSAQWTGSGQSSQISSYMAQSGGQVIIMGGGFSARHQVVIKGQGSTFMTEGVSNNGQSLIVAIPPQVTPGDYTVTVMSPQGAISQSSLRIFTPRTGAVAPPVASPVPTPVGTPPSSGISLPSLPRPCLLGLIFCPKPVQAATLNYVAVGDSLAVGLVAVRGYVQRYTGHIETDNGVAIRVQNLGVRGWRSGELLSALQSDQNFRTNLSQADVITWNIGGNDLQMARHLYIQGACGGADNQDCLRAALDEFRQNWNGIVVHMMNLRKHQHVMIRSMDIYYPFVAEDMTRQTWPSSAGQSDFHVLNQYLQEANRHITQTLQSQGIPYARVWQAFNGPTGQDDPNQKGLISFDNFHPNDNGHRVIVDLLRRTGYSELQLAAPVSGVANQPSFVATPTPAAPSEFMLQQPGQQIPTGQSMSMQPALTPLTGQPQLQTGAVVPGQVQPGFTDQSQTMPQPQAGIQTGSQPVIPPQLVGSQPVITQHTELQLPNINFSGPQPRIIDQRGPQPRIIDQRGPQPRIIDQRGPQPRIVGQRGPTFRIVSLWGPPPRIIYFF